MNEFQELIPDFLEESKEHLSVIKEDLAIVESLVRANKKPDDETTSSIFRAIHSIKFGSSFVGFKNVEELANKIKDFFSYVHNKDIVPNYKMIEAVRRAVEKLSVLIEGRDANDMGDISDNINELSEIADDELTSSTKKAMGKTISTNNITEGSNFTVSEYVLEKKLAKGAVYFIKVDPQKHIEGAGRNLIDFISRLSSLGEILDTSIDLRGENGFLIGFLYSTIMEEKALKLSFPYIPGTHIKRLENKKLFVLMAEKKAATAEVKPAEEKKPVRKNIPEIREPKKEEEPRQTSSVSKNTNELYGKLVEEKEDGDTEWEKYNEFVTFYIGGEQYAVPIFLVHDIKEMQPYSYLPNQPNYVIGVINLRGNVVPIFDMRKKLGVKEKEFDRQTVVLILNIKGQIKGCVVDSISDVVVLEKEHKQSTPLLSRNIKTEFVKFIGKDPKTSSFLIVLDIEKILLNN